MTYVNTLYHKYKNCYVEEQLDKNSNVISYKQFNDNILIIHRVWEYDYKNRNIKYIDVIENYIKNTSYHSLHNIEISNKWDSDGRHNIFYWQEISPFNYRHKMNNGYWSYFKMGV